MSVGDIPALVQRLYGIVGELEGRFPGRKFTPDGHLVGSIGEVLAASLFDLELLAASAEGHDAISKSGKLVQIKATQRNRVALNSEPAHLVVLVLNRGGAAEVVYNGPGKMAWESCGGKQKNGQSPITVGRLKKLMMQVPENEKLAYRNDV